MASPEINRLEEKISIIQEGKDLVLITTTTQKEKFVDVDREEMYRAKTQEMKREAVKGFGLLGFSWVGGVIGLITIASKTHYGIQPAATIFASLAEVGILTGLVKLSFNSLEKADLAFRQRKQIRAEIKEASSEANRPQ